MNKMILSNLLHRPVRSLITVIAVALEVTLILLMVGLATGILEDGRERQQGMGADVIVRPPGSSYGFTLTGAPVSIKVADVLRKLPHVNVVAPIVLQLTVVGGLPEVIYGIDVNTFEELGGPFRFLSGGTYQGPYDVLVDDYFASSHHVKVGATIEVLNHSFRISGIVQHGRGARKFLQMHTLQELIGAEGKASVFYLKLDDPNNAGPVVQEVQSTEGMQNWIVQSMREYLSLMTVNNLPALSAFIGVVIGVAVAIGFMVIFQAMYTAVAERTREIGILKSLGASRMYITNVILRETVLLAVIGIGLGIAISYTARAIIVNRIPTLRVVVPQGWIGYTILIAIVGAILGAIYPALKAARKDPIDALAYE
ncbi:MAG: FtsX-like permease family protein [Terriglobales bacterium]|jgi:putative ABC transport system permease protein